jgi:hypothetical protein
MLARLICQTGTDLPREIRLGRFPVLLGRGEESDVRVADRWVSRQHCSIQNQQGMLIVKDLGSRHGTWLNDQRVEEAELHPGDRLCIGLTTLTADSTPARKTYEPGWKVLLLGHVVASLLGLALGYYALCCLRPAEFNRWNLPIPTNAGWSDSAALSEEVSP